MAFALNLFTLIQTYVLIALPAGTNQSVANGNAKGKAFMVSFLKNFGNDGQNSIIITTVKKTRVYVHVPSTASLIQHVLSANSSIYVKLPRQTTVMSWGTPERKAVSVYSTELVSVYGLTSRSRSSAGYLAIPLDKWSDHYIVATYDGLQKNGGEIIIISAEDDTSISVWLNVVKFTRCVATNRTVDRSTLLSFHINKEDVLRIACDDDLTGSVVKGSKPIGVISGNTCTQVPINVPFCDQLMEMMIPTSNLGQDYIVAALSGKDTIFRVIYTNDKGTTNLTIEDMGTDVTVNKANRLYKEYTISSFTVVRLHASNPVLVVLYSMGTNNSQAYGDPSMVTLVPIERYDSDYNVACSWKTPSEMSHFVFDVNVYSPGNVSSPFAPRVDVLSSTSVFGFTVVHANITNSGLLTKNSFIPNSNIIFSASALGSTISFPIGMKLEFFTGVDNCSNSPCLNDGICYTHGARLACYCGDQLSGDRCENDILNACSSFPCQNNSTCTDSAYMFKCECRDNFTGDFCETEMKATTTPKPKTTVVAPKSTTTVVTPKSTTTVVMPKSTTTVVTPKSTTTVVTPKSSTTVVTPKSTTTVVTPKSTTTVVTPKSTTTVVTPKSTTTVVTPKSKTTLVTPKSKTTLVTPKSTTTVVTPKSKTTRETEMCRCTCENVTAEEIRDQKEQIKKELTVDAKETNKNKIRHTSAYDTRSSATGIGIVGILFLVLVFGCFMALDLMTAAAYIVMFIRNRRQLVTSEKYADKSTSNTTLSSQVNYYDTSPSNVPQPARNTVDNELPANDISSVGNKSELVMVPQPSLNSLYRHAKALRKVASESVAKDIRNHIPASAGTNPDLLYAKSSSQPSTFTHNVICLPRFQVDSSKILVVGEDGQTFKIRRCSWSCRKLVENPTCHASGDTQGN